MQVIIINDDMYDVEPAVASYIKQLERDKLDLQEGFYKLIAKQIAKIDELKAENEKLKEGYPKSAGVIAGTSCVG